RVGGALQTKAELVAGDGIVGGSKDGPHRELDLTVAGAMGEDQLETGPARQLAGFHRQPSVAGPGPLRHDAARFPSGFPPGLPGTQLSGRNGGLSTPVRD